MDFSLDTEQAQLRDSVAGYLAARYDLETSRAAVKSGAGWQPAIWRGFADELGILGATLPESVGGMGGGAVETMIVTEELGRALVVEPYVDTVVIGAGLLRDSNDLLAGIVEGSVRVALAAHEASSGGVLHDVSTSAERVGDYWVVRGSKVVVTSAPIATHLLLTARTSGERTDTAGISLFVLEFDAAEPPPGGTVHPCRTIDDRVAADLEFDELRLPATALVGEVGAAWESIERVVDEATAAVMSEAVGLMRKMLADTVDYAKQRKQFGQPIGRFQVLQHRMVDMLMELEQAVAAQHLAILNLGADAGQRARAVSAAKVTVGRAARFVGQNAVQLHGAMGMTVELAVGHYFKRLTAIENEFGSADRHLARYAALTRDTDRWAT